MCSTVKMDLVRALGADGNRRLSHLRRALTRQGTLEIVGGDCTREDFADGEHRVDVILDIGLLA
ncbi:MAG: hypothetical protein ACKV2O_10165 [Acidimicrobiales bacterium]